MTKYKKIYDPKRGCAVSERVLICEKALRRRAFHGMQTFEYEGQLVICQDVAYNRLLHARVKALKECGDADKRHCYLCKEYDVPENLYETEKGRYHQACHTKYCREKVGYAPLVKDGRCKRGHLIEGVHKNGKRFCRVCRDERWKRWDTENPRSKRKIEDAKRKV